MQAFSHQVTTFRDCTYHLLIFSNANSKWHFVNKIPFYIVYYLTLPHDAVQSNLDDSYGIVSLCVSHVLQMGHCVLRGVRAKMIDFFFLTPVYLYIYLFAILIKCACVFNRLRVPPSVCMRIRNLTEGDVVKGFLYLLYYCCLSLIYMHIYKYEFLLMIRQHILPSNANLSPWK